jgi:hypothetical protein
MLVLLAVAAGASVANVYYAQPLLDRLAQAFALDRAVAGAVLAATQAGSVLALLGLLPLADRGDRRRLLRMQLMALVLALLWLAAARTASWLLSGMLLAGLLGTALTQGLIAYTAAMAARAARARGGRGAGRRVHRPAAGARCVRAWRPPRLAGGLSAVGSADGGPGRAAVAAPAGGAGAGGTTALARTAGLDAGHAAPGPDAARARAAGIAAVCWPQCVLGGGTLPLSAPPLHWSTAAIGALGLAGVVGA